MKQLKEFCKALLFTYKELFIISEKEFSLCRLPQTTMRVDFRLYKLITKLRIMLFIALFSITVLFLQTVLKLSIVSSISYVLLVYFVFTQYIKIKADITSIISEPKIQQKEK